MGAWIEIILTAKGMNARIASRPSWARGLKLEAVVVHHTEIEVAPLMGAWIEIFKALTSASKFFTSRAPHGRVD